ncbi:ATP-dependent helicase [Candidatus Woesearchaeota archaeon]|nr:ATP-dependent helicase [Candidatus Woesearchaeota archaeon]
MPKSSPKISLKDKPNTKYEIDGILHPFVKEWFYKKFKSYSLPQLHAVMEIHSRNNILVSAPTGATKTLTGFLSILNELVDSADKGILEDRIYAIYISPLKALNEDIKVNLITPLEEIKEIARKYNREIDIRVAVRGGDTTTAEKAKMLKTPPHILITTPESLAIVLSSIKFIDNLKQVEWCIIDEIHALAENKRGTHLMLSIERLQHLNNDSLTRVGLSATVSPLEEIAEFLVGPNRECKIVNVQFIKQLDLQVLSAVDNLVDITYSDLHKKTYALIDEMIQKHKTTLIFTNTRAATERVVHHLREMFPRNYTETMDDDENEDGNSQEKEVKGIGAHHGSLSKEHRHSIERRLREGKLKCVVCSTSLELGIDIGYIDLVICLGSPKTVARALQRIGRSGHKLHETTKGRIIVMDRDDLVECSVLLKNAVEKKIDRIYIPKNALDVLSQQILGAAIQDVWDEKELYELITNTFPYKDLPRKDFDAIVSYLAGEYTELEDRSVYSKIWRENGKIGKRGKMTRILYMTNIGTIPSQSGVKVKLGNQIIGSLDETFLERLRKRDIFVLGGATYEFRFARGMTATVDVSIGKPPTVPSWVSEMLPLSFDLANDILRFRLLMEEKFTQKRSKKEIIDFINEYLYVNKKAAEAVYIYLKEQFDYALIPTNKRILVEYYKDERGKKIIFHSLYGRRVNDCLSRAIGYIISKYEKADVEIGINDNGFYIGTEKSINLKDIIKVLTTSDLYEIMNLAIDKTEVLKRRFRHCAERSLMILRTYMGRIKRAGKQQSISTILMAAIKGISNDFPILKEARREVLEDSMDVKSATIVVQQLKEGKTKVEEITTQIPSPFAFQLVLQGYTDVLKIDDKLDFLKRMHSFVLAKIAVDKGKKGEEVEFNLPKIDLTANPVREFKDFISHIKHRGNKSQKKLAQQLYDLEDRIPLQAKMQIARCINEQPFDQDVLRKIKKYEKFVRRKWPKELAEFLLKKADEYFSYEEEWERSGNEDGNDRERKKEQIELEKQEEKIKMLLEDMHNVHKEIGLEPLIYYEFERFIENPKGVFDRKFKKWINELLQPPIPRLWPNRLITYIKENIKHLK